MTPEPRYDPFGPEGEYVTPQRTVNWCGYQSNGIRIAVVYPYKDSFAVANRTYGGYPVEFATLADAQANVVIRNPFLAYWQEEQVSQ